MTIPARLTRELQIIQMTPIEGFQLTDVPDMLNWQGLIESPSSSPYRGKKFNIQIQFPSSYPHAPPTVRFLESLSPTHPHIDNASGGNVCMKLITSEGWGPTYMVKHVIAELRVLLTSLDS